MAKIPTPWDLPLPTALTWAMPPPPPEIPVEAAAGLPMFTPESSWGGLTGALDIMDRPANLLRATLAGDPAAGLRGMIPFGETAGVFRPEHRYSGQDVLFDEPDPDLLSAKGMAGLGLEMALDPLNLLYGLGAFTKSGKAAKGIAKAVQGLKRAEAIEKAVQASRIAKAAEAGAEVAKAAEPLVREGEPLLEAALRHSKVPPAGRFAKTAREVAADLEAKGIPLEQIGPVLDDWGKSAEAGLRASLGIGGEYYPIPLPLPGLPKFDLPEKVLLKGAPFLAGLQKMGKGLKGLPGIRQAGRLFSQTPGVEEEAAKILKEELEESRRQAKAGRIRAEEQAQGMGRAMGEMGGPPPPPTPPPEPPLPLEPGPPVRPVTPPPAPPIDEGLPGGLFPKGGPVEGPPGRFPTGPAPEVIGSILPPPRPLEPPRPVIGRQDVDTAMRGVIGDEGTDAVMAVTDARARVWAKANQANPEEWYRQKIAAVEYHEEIPGDVRKFMEAKGVAQDPRAAAKFLDDGRAIIMAFKEGRDAPGIVHEVWHVFRRDLPVDDLRRAELAYGVRGGQWQRAHEEAFVEDALRYMATRTAPTPELKSVFEKFRQWLLELWRTMRGAGVVDDTKAGIFDRLLSDAEAIPESMPIGPRSPLPKRSMLPPASRWKPPPPIYEPRVGDEVLYRPKGLKKEQYVPISREREGVSGKEFFIRTERRRGGKPVHEWIWVPAKKLTLPDRVVVRREAERVMKQFPPEERKAWNARARDLNAVADLMSADEVGHLQASGGKSRDVGMLRSRLRAEFFGDVGTEAGRSSYIKGRALPQGIERALAEGMPPELVEAQMKTVELGTLPPGTKAKLAGEEVTVLPGPPGKVKVKDHFEITVPEHSVPFDYDVMPEIPEAPDVLLQAGRRKKPDLPRLIEETPPGFVARTGKVFGSPEQTRLVAKGEELAKQFPTSSLDPANEMKRRARRMYFQELDKLDEAGRAGVRKQVEDMDAKIHATPPGPERQRLLKERDLLQKPLTEAKIKEGILKGERKRHASAIRQYLQDAGYGATRAARRWLGFADTVKPETQRYITDLVEGPAGEIPVSKEGKLAQAIKDRIKEIEADQAHMDVATPTLKDPRVEYITRVPTTYGANWWKNLDSDSRAKLFLGLDEMREKLGLRRLGEKRGLEMRRSLGFEAQTEALQPHLVGEAKKRWDALQPRLQARLMEAGLEREFVQFDREIANWHASMIPRLDGLRGFKISELNDFFRKNGNAQKLVFSEDPSEMMFVREVRHARHSAADAYFKGAASRLGHEIDPAGIAPQPVPEAPGISEWKPPQGAVQPPELGPPDMGGPGIPQRGGYGVDVVNAIRAKKGLNPLIFEDLQVAKTAHKTISQMLEYEELNELLTWYDKALALMKSAVTRPFPAFHLRNRVSNRIQSWLHGVPVVGDHYRQARELMMGGGDQELLEEAIDQGVMGGGFMYSEVVGPSIRSVGTWNPLDPQSHFIRAGERASAALLEAPGRAIGGLPQEGVTGLLSTDIENVDRLGHYLYKRLKEGLSPEMARTSVDYALFDYDALSEFEKQVGRRIAFFYTYQRKVIPMMLERLISRPGQVKAMGQIAGGAGGPREGLPEDMPQWLREGLPVPLGTEPGGLVSVAHQFGTPLEAAAEPFAGFSEGPRRGFEKIGSMVNPMLRVPMELLTNRSFFLSRPIEEMRKAPHWVGMLPQPVQDALGIREIKGPGGEHKRWEGPPEALYVLGSSPVSRVSSTTSKLADPGKALPEKLANVFTGASIVGIDPELESYFARKRAREKQLKAMEREGRVKTFTGYYGASPEDLEARAAMKAVKK